MRSQVERAFDFVQRVDHAPFGVERRSAQIARHRLTLVEFSAEKQSGSDQDVADRSSRGKVRRRLRIKLKFRDGETLVEVIATGGQPVIGRLVRLACGPRDLGAKTEFGRGPGVVRIRAAETFVRPSDVARAKRGHRRR